MVVGELAHERDTIIIGGGPGGYHAAIRAAQLGQSVTIIEKEMLGGVCLNKGCIPSKVFTHTAEKLSAMGGSAEFGIEAGHISFNFQKLNENKTKTIERLREGIKALCKANKVEIINGNAFFLTDDRIAVENGDQYDVFRFKHAIIATGSTPEIPEWVTVDHERILDSWSITDLGLVPDRLLIYGSDYIALEMAMSFQAFGAKVTMILDESKDDFCFDHSINRELKRVLKKRHIHVIRKAKVINVQRTLDGVSLTLDIKDEKEELNATHLFVSSQMKPNIDNLGIYRIGLKITEDRFITVNQKCQTSKQNIYAVGDVTEGPFLAVKAIKQGKTAAEAIAGVSTEADFQFIPVIAHTRPPIASTGLTEEQALLEGYEVEIGQFPLTSNGYSSILGKKDGFIKAIIDKESRVLLGLHMMGDGAVELISSGIISLEMAARDEDLIFPLYPHPSINEGLLEAMEALKNKAIHIPPGLRKESLNV